jgi:hypothetical protein
MNGSLVMMSKHKQHRTLMWVAGHDVPAVSVLS